MILSKSFGYALRSVLYVAMMNNETRNIQQQEIAEKLGVPRHFLGKVMKRLVKIGMIDSSKGHSGGYIMNQRTLSIPLIELVTLIEGDALFKTCIIGFKKCNEKNPCPLHNQIMETRKQMIKTFSETKIGDLLIQDKSQLIKSLVTT
jgi:Rrf2 family transcriptional regulator, iron-sulfur cluster assembly transcription factor